MRLTQPILSLYEAYHIHLPWNRGQGVFRRAILGLMGMGFAPPLLRGAEGIRIEFGTDVLHYELFVRQSWEPEMTEFMAGLVPRGGVVIDVGANVGYFSLLFSRWVGAEGHVYAFEPIRRTFATLQANLRANGATNVTALKKACFSSPGEAKMLLDTDSGWSRLTTDGSGHEVVELTTIDEFVRQTGLSRVDFIKIDAEGVDFEVLRGALGTLERHRSTVLLEVLEGDQYASSEAGVRALVAPLGYEVEVVPSRWSKDVVCRPR